MLSYFHSGFIIGFAVQVDFEGEYRIPRDTRPGTVFGSVVAESGTTVEYFTTNFDSGTTSNAVQWADVDRRTGQLRIIRNPKGRFANMEITLLSEGFTKTITVSYSLLTDKIMHGNFS
ncbi:unnamed protein product [Gongylonema pulchrum]|uniref:BIG2 domain-containing protein n=1 Tax=Gongylonema pulchrum TaxID=637853 RepID=A0A183F159_9BILA|nr:unnamed protein product [Gongylonema pulchrum]